MHRTSSLPQRTVSPALDNVAEGGKPFACIVVEAATGVVLTEATNRVAQSGDPTAPAEIVAIRDLAARGRTDLGGCDVYVTAYPCPMCLGALYYAAPEQVIFAATRTFYDEYAKAPEERALPTSQATTTDPSAPFRAWTQAHPEHE